MTTSELYKVADLCAAAADGDLARIREILAAAPELINVHRAENDEHCAPPTIYHTAPNDSR